jgi:aspartate-semialdehyde dehydrogenase
MLVALKPLHDEAKIKRVVVSTYQAVSGSGHQAVTEYQNQLKDSNYGAHVYPHQIAHNVLPHIGDFGEDGYTSEEWKMHNETRKMFEDDEIKVTSTTVRVPVITSHAEAINIETERKLTPKRAKEILKNAPSVVLQDDPHNNVYPLSLDVEGRDEVFVGRIREDFSIDNGLNLWVVSDNLRKGAATNAVQIAELLI